MAGERVQRRGLTLADPPFASSQDDRIVVDRRGRACVGVCAHASQSAPVPAGCVKSEVATATERYGGAGKIESPQILARLRQGDMQQAGFIACPTRTLIAEAEL